MNLKKIKLLFNNVGVAPVVGVILMVGVTTVLSATTATYVMDYGAPETEYQQFQDVTKSAKYSASTDFVPTSIVFHSESRSPKSDSIKKPKYVTYNEGHVFMNMQTNPGYIVSYDVKDPSNPTISDTLNIAQGNNGNGGYANAIQGDYLYTGLNGGSLVVVGISDSEKLTNVGSSSFGGQPFDIDISGDYVYIADASGSGLRVFDVKDKSNPKQVANIKFPAGGVDVQGNYAYLTDYSNGFLKIFDISNPENPNLVNQKSIGSMFVPVDVVESYAYVQKYNGNDIKVIDISNPNNPEVVTTLTTPSSIPNGGAVKVQGEYLYLTTGQGGNGAITVYKNGDFSKPVIEYTIDGNPEIATADVNDRFIYVPDFDNRNLKIFKVKS